MMLKEGDKAPTFTLESDAGTKMGLGSPPGQTTVVYFYPRDNTPGCTREAIEFTRAAAAFRAAGALVFGISKDSIAAHCKFRDAYQLAIPLLSDPDLAVHKAFGAFGTKTMYGKKVEGVIRSTFIVTADGRIGKVFPSVKVDGHAEKVLAAVRELAGSTPGVRGDKRVSARSPRRSTTRGVASTPGQKAENPRASAKPQAAATARSTGTSRGNTTAKGAAKGAAARGAATKGAGKKVAPPARARARSKKR